MPNQVPNDHHVSRLCHQRHIANGRIKPSAFKLRDSDNYLSVNWLEYLSRSSRIEEIATIRIILSRKLSFRSPSRIAVLNAGKVVSEVKQLSRGNRELSVVHYPEPNDDSHCGIVNYTSADEEIAVLIHQSIIEEHPACI